MSKSAKGKQRAAANTAESASMSTNERVLKECHELYNNNEKGLVRLGEELKMDLLSPRKKITVLLLGNHSAGKSSFINWYVEEHVQKTAVAIETQGFALVTSGKRRESLTGNATLHLFPQFRELQQIEGVVDYLSTEIATSKEKKFPFLTFIDTPGLVDGDMKYPFDVDQAINWLGRRADLILVFFDPLGQALCRRTLNIVERLNEIHPDRIHFYLSKADTAGTEGDRQRVLMQITQELCKRPGLNKAGFDMPTIFIPTLTGKHVHCENHLDEVCQEIDKAITRNIQNTLNSLEKDATLITTEMQKCLQQDSLAARQNASARCRAAVLYVSGPSLAIVYVMAGSGKLVGLDLHPWLLALVLLVAAITVLFGMRAHRISKTLSRKERSIMMDKLEYLERHVKSRKTILYQDYLKQSIAGLDM